MPELLTVTEVAATLRISTQTVRSLIKRGKLPGFQIGHVYRIPEAAVARLVNAERDPEQIEDDRLVRQVSIEDRLLVQEVSAEVFGWIDDLKAKYPGVDVEIVRQIYGDQLQSGETPLDRSAVEDVFIGVKLGIFGSEVLST